MYLSGQAVNASYLQLNTSGNVGLVMNGANVGINMTNPTTALQVNGVVKATSFSGGGAAAAWVTFDGTSGSILASYNVSSVTRNGTGDYTVFFATPMPDTNYIYVGSTNGDGNSGGSVPRWHITSYSTATYLAGSFRLVAGYQHESNWAFVDSTKVNVVFFR